MRNVRKLRSKNYSRVIEVLIPSRFYWRNNDFDGVEFGPMDEPTKQELKNLREILAETGTGIEARHIIQHIKVHHKDFLRMLISEMEAEEQEVPRPFLDAFREEE